MMKLTEKEVKDVAHLARLQLTEEEVPKYQEALGQILTEINKINEANITPEEALLIAPTTNQNCYNEDEVRDMITKEDAFSNSKNSNGMYIVVPKVVND